ncbi:uncharacterized protein LOC101856085 [Aplysia californica]|uniref:Uncharacterized protein LOC101856085 n=1 Tax=Aplysia californica TaxID=6500 RepID=A0ABM0JI67_APLCA|nr:uncharacterized protein LOC101856085 [Aplysia californica]
MLLFTATTALLLSSVLALPSGTMDMGSQMMNNMGMPTHPCCTPARWQGAILDLKSATGILYVTTFAQDATQELEGTVTVNRMTEEIVSQTFTDFKTKMTYSVNMYGDKKGQCMSAPTTHDFYETCHNNKTSNAVLGYQYEGNATLGGPSGLMYDAWNIQFTAGMNITIALTRTGCIPVLENVMTSNAMGGITDSLFLFNDVTTTVDDALLKMPAACAATNSGVVG